MNVNEHLVVNAGFPVPALATSTPVLNRLVALNRRLMPGLKSEMTDDFDLFVESALRLEHMIARWPNDRLWVRQFDQPSFGGSRDRETVVNVATGERREYGDFVGAYTWGNLSTADPDPAAELLVNRQGYAGLTAFRQHAGRFTQLCSALEDEEGATDRTEVIAALRAAGNAAVVKVVARDKVAPLAFIDGIPELSDNDLWQELEAGFGEGGEWLMYRYAVVSDAYLVQSRIDMHHEYRLFIVNHEVVAGAGCIVDFTPLDNTGQVFDHRTQHVRGSGRPVSENPEVVERLVAFGREVAAQIRGELPDATGYTLDVAVDGAGNPVIVELNSILGSGLYALHLGALSDALVQSRALPQIAALPQMPGLIAC